MQYNKLIYKFSRAKSEALVNILKFYFKKTLKRGRQRERQKNQY